MLTDLFGDVSARTCIDRNQVLTMGFAVGGVMAALVACNDEIDVAAPLRCGVVVATLGH